MNYDLLIQSRVFWVLVTLVGVLLLCGFAYLIVVVIWKVRKMHLGETIRFKYLYPEEIKPEESYPFLIFSTFVPDVRSTLLHQPHIVEVLVKQRISGLLKDKEDHYLHGNVRSKRRVRTGRYLRFKPVARGLRFNPRRQEPEWGGKIVPHHFLVKASRKVIGQAVKGEIKVSIWLLPIARLNFEIAVTEHAKCEPFELPELRPTTVIFPSYAREDAHVLSEFESKYKKIGVEYLCDRDIPAGSEWDQTLTTYIARADICQLFWSQHAARSTYIPEEIKRARELLKPIYPTILVEQRDGESAEPRTVATEMLEKDLFDRYPEFAKAQVTSHSYVPIDSKRNTAYLMAPFVSSASAMPSGLAPILTLAAIVVVSTAAGLYIHKKMQQPPREIVVRPEEFPPPTPASAKTYNIGGRIHRADGTPMKGVVVTLTNGKSGQTATTDSTGNYKFTDLKEGANYVVTPSQKSGVFSPQSHTLQYLQKDESITFSLVTFTISGVVTTGQGYSVPRVKILLERSRAGLKPRTSATTETDEKGSYSFDGLESIYTYKVTPDFNNQTFNPPSREFRSPVSNQVANFVAPQLIAIPLIAPIIRASVKAGAWPQKEGGVASFVVTVTNVGDSDARQVQVSLEVSDLLRINEPRLQLGDGPDKDASYWIWTIEDLRRNETKTLSVEAELHRDLNKRELYLDSLRDLLMVHRVDVIGYQDARGRKYP